LVPALPQLVVLGPVSSPYQLVDLKLSAAQWSEVSVRYTGLI
jgi:hypothetical protein